MTERISYPRLGEEVTRRVLPSGLPVYVVRKPGFSRKYALFAVHYGGMDVSYEHEGRSFTMPAGIAHYLEHKTFDTADGNAMQTLAQNGAEPNAFTSNSITAYYFDCTDRFIENLRELLSFVTVPYFTGASVEKEQGIIAREIRMIEDSPDWIVYRNMMRLLYPDSSVSIPVAGSEESIRTITAETLYACHRAFYRPDNMCLVVVGDVEESEVFAAAEEIVVPQAKSKLRRRYEIGAPAQKFQRVSCTGEVSRPQFLLGVRVSGETCETRISLRESLIGSIAAELLMGQTSPLYHRLYDAGLIDESFECGYEEILPGTAYVYAGGESSDPEAVRRAVEEEAYRMGTESVDGAYFRRIHRAMFGIMLKDLNSFEDIALDLVDGCFYGYDALQIPEAFDAITLQDVQAFIHDHICQAPSVLSVMEPKEETIYEDHD